MHQEDRCVGPRCYTPRTLRFVVPFMAEDIETLSHKVLNQKPSLLPHSVNKSFQKITQRCLLKKPELRATVEEIILMDDF